MLSSETVFPVPEQGGFYNQFGHSEKKGRGYLIFKPSIFCSLETKNGRYRKETSSLVYYQRVPPRLYERSVCVLNLPIFTKRSSLCPTRLSYVSGISQSRSFTSFCNPNPTYRVSFTFLQFRPHNSVFLLFQRF